ncbi:MAG: N-acetyl-D-Glu racemase DgcA [Hyphomicrobiaceae bacterium]
MSPHPPTLSVTVERWPTAGSFTIARGAKTAADVVVASISDGIATGRGEAVPYPRYGETVDGAAAAIRAYDGPLSRAALADRMPAGAARNAIDLALWDFEAKASGVAVAARIGCPSARPLLTAYTLSLDTPDAMAGRARAAARYPLLKLKLGGGALDGDRLRAIRAGRPDARLIADANESWSETDLAMLMAVARETGIELIEQPLPAGKEGALAAVRGGVALCADESLHTRADLDRIATLYDAVNIKLDKTGGLTEALALKDAARERGLKVMVGCMVATSLAMAPAVLLAQGADWADLDGPLLLARDREPGLGYDGAYVAPPTRELWG